MTDNAVTLAMPFLDTAEGFKANAYQDEAGVWTVGFGETGPDIGPGSTTTRTAAQAWLLNRCNQLCARIRAAVHVPITDNQCAALISFAYNEGIGAFLSSTLLAKLNAGDYAGALAEFPRWDKVNEGGKLVDDPGLDNRRAHEQQLWQAAA